jgi:hypothetical protein
MGAALILSRSRNAQEQDLGAKIRAKLASGFSRLGNIFTRAPSSTSTIPPDVWAGAILPFLKGATLAKLSGACKRFHTANTTSDELQGRIRGAKERQVLLNRVKNLL